ALPRPGWLRSLAGSSSLGLAAALAIGTEVVRAPQRIGRLSAGAVFPRFAPHGAVLALVVAAIAAGGFARPEGGLEAPLATEAGALTADARLLLGPRAAEAPVRDTLLRPPFSATNLAPSQPRMDATTYVVRPGDSLWAIGARFNVGAWSVMWSNGLDEDSLILPGQQLKIPPVQGVVAVVGADDSLETIAARFGVEPATIVDFNGLKPGELLQPNRILIVPGGSLPIAPRPVPEPAAVAPRPQLPSLPIRPPAQPAPQPARPQTPAQTQPQRPAVPAPAAPARPVPAPPVPAPAPTGRFSWPTRGVITTYFSGWHPGIDIASAFGTNIGAADGGTVSSAGWNNWGYGYRVVIDHGNGYATTYNHLSVISVRPGQAVAKGQQVGLMGSTGNSTGPHLHFEILRGGGYINPLGALG
ncbi:MAG TPA: peptidoglycan DD-metalloendopeptidase family protein, partial [Chloroflexota bacterium]|nr:peptidoglycan DD-metalloendopeptidase family protein [Chloroflexota bacterium]